MLASHHSIFKGVTHLELQAAYTVKNIRQGAKILIRYSIFLYQYNAKIDKKLKLDLGKKPDKKQKEKKNAKAPAKKSNAPGKKSKPDQKQQKKK